MQKFTLPAIDAIQARDGCKTARDTYAVGDMIQTAALFEGVNKGRRARKSKGDGWRGGMSFDDSLRCVREGNPAIVARSDEFLSRFEALHLVSRRWRTVAAVAGGVPCVPAALAGHPLAMRQRQRVSSDQAPLAIIVDIASSGGIESADLEKRGAAILALVRLLSAARPVSLYVGVSVTAGHLTGAERHDACHIFTRMDTAPLDLARAAHMLCHTSTARSLYYGAAYELTGAPLDEANLCWPYRGGQDVIRTHAHAILARAIPDAAQSLYIGAAHMDDAAIKNPALWLETMLKEHGGAPVQEAA
jgi:hypothetical protein